MMMEAMGLHVPGAAFANPGTKLRQELTRAAVHRLAAIGWTGRTTARSAAVVDEKAIVNAAIGLLATGGSTNHLHPSARIARAAGIVDRLGGFDRLSRAVPLSRGLSQRLGRREPVRDRGRPRLRDPPSC
jgi:phosphogluconate dehydratase